MRNIPNVLKFFLLIIFLLISHHALSDDTVNVPQNGSSENQPKVFFVNNFKFMVKPIKYLQNTNELIAPSLNVYLNRDLVFDLSNNPKQIDFTKIMFGTTLSDQSTEILDLTGEGRSYYVLATFSGGVRCCYSYFILELLENGIKLLQKLDTGGSTIDFITNSNNRGYTLKLKDMNFANFYSAYERSVFPEVNLIFNRSANRFESNLIIQPISDTNFSTLLTQTAAEVNKNFEQFGNLDIVINPILMQSIKLIYSGNAIRAFELIDKTWPIDYKLFKKESFTNNLKCKLKESPFWQDINNINPNLMIPSDCAS